MDYDRIDPQKYEKMYDEVQREIYMKEHWRPIIKEKIEKYCKDKNVLDLGCGTGIYTQTINKYANKVYGLDIAYNWVMYTKYNKNICRVIRADAHEIPLKNKSIDVIVTTGLFEYVNRKIVIKEMNRILTHEGICIIFVPNKYSLFRLSIKLISKIIGKKYDPKEPSKREVLKLFDENKFNLIEYNMSDGLIWIPNILDKFAGKEIYSITEKFMSLLGENPFSNVMLFIAKKRDENST